MKRVRSERPVILMSGGIVLGVIAYVYALNHSDQLPMVFPGRTDTRYVRVRSGIAVAVHSPPHLLLGVILGCIAAVIFAFGVYLATHSYNNLRDR